MKKLFILAVLSVALNALAEDQFLYWMIGENATGADDTTKLTDGTYYAKVRTAPWTGDYLNLFVSPDEATYGQVYKLDYSSTFGSWETFAGFANGQASIPGNFFVELYADKDCTDWVGGANLEYVAGNITGGGMGHADAAVVTAFNVVPEPTSGLLLLLGVAGLALKRKRA